MKWFLRIRKKWSEALWHAVFVKMPSQYRLIRLLVLLLLGSAFFNKLWCFISISITNTPPTDYHYPNTRKKNPFLIFSYLCKLQTNYFIYSCSRFWWQKQKTNQSRKIDSFYVFLWFKSAKRKLLSSWDWFDQKFSIFSNIIKVMLMFAQRLSNR